MLSFIVGVLVFASTILASPAMRLPTLPQENTIFIQKGSNQYPNEPVPHQRGIYPIFPMTPEETSVFAPYTHLAAAAYCDTALIQSWQCGEHCLAIQGMVTYAAGGNDSETPDWYVGYLPSLASAVVVHQGTTPENIMSVWINVNFTFNELNPTYFPGVNASVQVHSGFAAAQNRTTDLILAAVTQIMMEHGVEQITCVGHSLGGALAVLDALAFKLMLPNSTSIKLVTYGQPRVGNQEFANLVDTLIPDVSRITNKGDIVPIVPGMGIGFHHCSGEKHIDPNNTWWACSGQDNESDPQCSTGQVGTISDGNTDDHDGPYDDGIVMGC